MFRSLRFKIVVILVIVNMLSFIAMNLINYEISNKQMSRQLERQSLNEVKNTVLNLKTLLSLRLNKAELLTHSETMRTGTAAEKMAYLATEIPDQEASYAHFGIADAQSGTLTLDNGLTLQRGDLPAEFAQAAAGRSVVSAPRLDFDGNPVMWIFVPMQGAAGAAHQVLVLAVDSVRLFSSLLDLKNNNYEDSAIILIDRDTNLLHYTANPSLILKRNYVRDEPSIEQFAEQIRSSEEGFGEAYFSGRVLKMFYVKVPDYDWYAVLSVSKKEFEAPLRLSLWINMGLIALAELVLGFILYLLTQKFILNRLKQVVAVTQRVASGDFYTPPIPVQSNDEIGALAISVNGMTENIRDLFEPFQTFIRHNKYAMIVTDARFVITSFNRLGEELLGYKESEVVGKRAMLMWHDEKQLQERANLYAEKLKVPVAADESALFAHSLHGLLPEWEWNWITRDGTRLLVTVNPSIMRHPDGSVKGYVIIARDIGEIKKTVETNTRLLEIMESAHDMIASFDLQGRIFYLNQAGQSFLGITELSERNNRLTQYMPIPMTIRFADGLAEAQKHGYWQSETEFISTDGALLTASITVVAHFPDNGGETFFSTIVRDISGQKETQRQLVQAKEKADEANEAKSSFLARMSHEIRTPLNGIIGLTYLLQRSELTDIQQDYLRKISSSSQSLLHILNDILDFSKMEAGKLTIEKALFRLDDLLQRLSGIFSVLLGPKPVDFMIDVDPLVPETLIGDPTRLEQVLLNLGSNAIKFTNYGLIELRIRLVEHTGSHALLGFVVKDSGIGMTPQQLSQLFVPFVQADDRTSRKYGGTGLGLVISRTLVDKMGGQIKVDSAYREGSTFSFELAFDLADNEASPPHAPALNLNTLVLEDNPQVAAHWRKLLAAIGCDAETAGTWEQMQRHIAAKKPDVVIIDMEAGDMHGEETWVNWKKSLDEQHIIAIASTSLLGRDALHQLQEHLRPAAVIVKPSPSSQVHQILLSLGVLSNAAAAAAAEELQETPQASPAKLRILVVDDQEINRLVAKQLLEPLGFQVALSSSGIEALHGLEQSVPDLVLMDLHMPGMDGIEATCAIRDQLGLTELPIIALTADVTADQHARCLAAGMNDVITKPIIPEKLHAIVSNLLSIPLSLDAFSPGEPAASWEDMPGLEVRLALARLDGRSKLYLQLLNKFERQYADIGAHLQQLLEAGETGEAVRLAHALSGAAGHLGASLLQQAASAVEFVLQAGQPGEAELDAFRQALSEAMDSIRGLLRQKSY